MTGLAKGQPSGLAVGAAPAALLAALLVILLGAAEARAQGAAPSDTASRLALLIGNPIRQEGAETGPSPAFAAIADLLERQGFAVTKVENASKSRMSEAIHGFTSRLGAGSTALFLFRGALLRVGQQNLVMSLDARGSSPSAAREAGIDFGAFQEELAASGAATKIIIVDAAGSEVAADRFGVTASGATALDLRDGTLAILDTGRSPAPPAGDSLLLAELLKQAAVPNITAEQAFARTRVAVARASGGRQVPSVSSSLLTDFSLTRDAPGSAPPSPPPSPSPAPSPAPSSPAPQSARNPSAKDAPPTEPSTSGPKPGEIFKDCETCPELVVVPAGEFTMGATDSEAEKPPHRVAIARPFAIGRQEVTFAQWDACVAAGACRSDVDDHGYGRGRQPVIDVSWDEAQSFLKWLSSKTGQAYRLPSEAEWEYAARAGSRSAFPWGAGPGSGKANCDDCSPSPARAPLAVGSFRPNAFGLYDTAGNAAEWVEDCWNGSYKGAPADGAAWRKGSCELRVLRGGAFANKANAARASARFRYDRDVRYYTNGFRVVREVQDPSAGR